MIVSDNTLATQYCTVCSYFTMTCQLQCTLKIKKKKNVLVVVYIISMAIHAHPFHRCKNDSFSAATGP